MKIRKTTSFKFPPLTGVANGYAMAESKYRREHKFRKFQTLTIEQVQEIRKAVKEELKLYFNQWNKI